MTKSLPISGPSSAAFGQPHKPAIDRRSSTNRMITKPTSGESPPPSRSGGGDGGGGRTDGTGGLRPGASVLPLQLERLMQRPHRVLHAVRPDQAGDPDLARR